MLPEDIADQAYTPALDTFLEALQVGLNDWQASGLGFVVEGATLGRLPDADNGNLDHRDNLPMMGVSNVFCRLLIKHQNSILCLKRISS